MAAVAAAGHAVAVLAALAVAAVQHFVHARQHRQELIFVIPTIHLVIAPCHCCTLILVQVARTHCTTAETVLRTKQISFRLSFLQTYVHAF